MERNRQIDILRARAALAREIRELKKRRDEIAMGAASASVSAGSGSKSYSNFTPAQLQEVINQKTAEWRALGARLAGSPAGGIRHVVTVRS